MNINEAFPSNFLKAEDLHGKNIVCQIASIDLEEIGQGTKKDRKLVISFRGKEKKFVCNKTNAGTIGKLFGPETDDWIGQNIVIGPREVEFQGAMTWAIRVSLQKPPAKAAAAAPTPPPPPPSTENEEDVPF